MIFFSWASATVLSSEAERKTCLYMIWITYAFCICISFHFQTYRKALSGQVPIPDHFTIVVANLIKKLLHTDQSKRLGRTVGGTTAVMCHRWYANFDWVSKQYDCVVPNYHLHLYACLFFVPFCPSPCFSISTARQDALLEYRMDAPCLPEVKDPDHYSESEMDGDVEGFASDFLWFNFSLTSLAVTISVANERVMCAI